MASVSQIELVGDDLECEDELVDDHIAAAVLTAAPVAAVRRLLLELLMRSPNLGVSCCLVIPL